MIRKFIFDVDGTLTPSRGIIDSNFKKFFNEFCRNNQVFLVTGSDKPKTIEQIGEDTYNLAHTVYNCSGNDVWQSRKHIRTNNWTLPNDAQEWLTRQLTESNFVLRTGNHFEHRTGMVNYSIVGRNATLGERKLYIKWDKEHNERESISKNFNLLFTGIEARIGGETGLDISPKGSDKSQIIKDFDKNDQLHFFGDAMHPEGNDYPLMKKIIDNGMGLCYNVRNWEDTWKQLKNV